MSAIGLPGPHLPDEDHFDGEHLCLCPCEECTTRTAQFCVCLDCACDPDDPEAPSHFAHEWIG